MKKVELLSPAGNMECLKAAINAGCDAVYLGGYNFGARNYATNFSNEEIEEAIKYAHIYGVKVYVTVNTMIYENEVEEFIKYIDFLHKINVDAIIIQDLGMMDYIRKTYPNLEIHASTQMNVHNFEGALLLEKLGVKRVVLARETDPKIIKKIKEKLNIEVETFVHGALCFSYSGQCLMSSLIGGRSGNRGTCSQCCRMKYDLFSQNIKLNQDKYLLSMKDLNTIMNIKKLIDLGIDSFKIEGRMKRPEYVYLITKLYRKAIDWYEITKNDIIEMEKIFNRKFTSGFILNEKNNMINEKRPNHMGIKIGKILEQKNKTKIKLSNLVRQGDGIRIISKKDTGLILNKIYKDGCLVKEANGIIEIDLKDKVYKDDIVVKTTDIYQIENLNEEMKTNKKIKIDVFVKVKKDELIELTLKDDKNKVTVYSLKKVELAKTSITSRDRIISQITKFGNTPFIVNKVNAFIDPLVFVNIKELNELRRKAVIELENKRLYQIPYLKKEYNIDLPDFKCEHKYSILLKNKDDYKLIKNLNFEDLYLNNTLYNEIEDSRKVLCLPRINDYLEEKENLLLVSDLGSVYKYKNVITNFNFNVTNSYTVAFLHSLGVKKVTLSYELNKEQIENIIKNYKFRYKKHPNLELIINSYPETMISKVDILGKYNINSGYLKDIFNNKFKVLRQDNLTTIFHYDKITLNDNYFDLGINSLRINIEDKEDIKILKK